MAFRGTTNNPRAALANVTKGGGEVKLNPVNKPPTTNNSTTGNQNAPPILRNQLRTTAPEIPIRNTNPDTTETNNTTQTPSTTPTNTTVEPQRAPRSRPQRAALTTSSNDVTQHETKPDLTSTTPPAKEPPTTPPVSIPPTAPPATNRPISPSTTAEPFHRPSRPQPPAPGTSPTTSTASPSTSPSPVTASPNTTATPPQNITPSRAAPARPAVNSIFSVTPPSGSPRGSLVNGISNGTTPPGRPASRPAPGVLKSINSNVDIDWVLEPNQLSAKKESLLDEVIDMIMSFALNFLLEGIILTDNVTQSSVYYRLSEEQLYVEWCKIDNPATFYKSPNTAMTGSEKINIADITDIQPKNGQESTVLSISLKSGEKTLSAKNREELVMFVDGLRCLAGMDMITPEMQGNLRAHTEARAISQLYQKPQPPQRPNNFNFVLTD